MQKEEDTMKKVMDTRNMNSYWRYASKCAVELCTLLFYLSSLENINLPAPF